MVGVIANPAEECAVREFFELFKVPWEFFRGDRQYDVVLCTSDEKLDGIAAKLLLLYAGKKTSFDTEKNIQICSQRHGSTLTHRGSRFPIYGRSVTFPHQGISPLSEETAGEPVAKVGRFGEKTFARVGYDLFAEVQALLSKGQPASNAGMPTLDLHIAFLRDLITGSGLPLVEIPPVPDGYHFMACLTHDVDHASLGRHRFDRTMFGFLYRATLGSVVNAGRGRLPLGKLFANWAAAVKLPFIHFGLAKDFWYQFDRYLEIEKGKPSTFFVIPFQGRPGRSKEGNAPQARASRSDVSHIEEKIPRLMSAGCEIGLHGIDAWIDSSTGREEACRISGFSGKHDLGVRMHWLYMNEESPTTLEQAGFCYDSTLGYNETVGYRAGTSQVFKPLQATRMLELPLHVMDTALFYPDRLNLSPTEAWQRLAPLLDNAIRNGGVLTINWHDRSIAPERLWGDFYVRLLDELAARGAWFCTAAQAVSWFRKRRSATFQKVDWEGGRLQAKVVADSGEAAPGLRLRFHRPRVSPEPVAAAIGFGENYSDRGFDGNSDVSFSN